MDSIDNHYTVKSNSNRGRQVVIAERSTLENEVYSQTNYESENEMKYSKQNSSDNYLKTPPRAVVPSGEDEIMKDPSSAKRISNLVPSSAAKRRKVDMSGLMIELNSGSSVSERHQNTNKNKNTIEKENKEPKLSRTDKTKHNREIIQIRSIKKSDQNTNENKKLQGATKGSQDTHMSRSQSIIMHKESSKNTSILKKSKSVTNSLTVDSQKKENLPQEKKRLNSKPSISTLTTKKSSHNITKIRTSKSIASMCLNGRNVDGNETAKEIQREDSMGSHSASTFCTEDKISIEKKRFPAGSRMKVQSVPTLGPPLQKERVVRKSPSLNILSSTLPKPSSSSLIGNSMNSNTITHSQGSSQGELVAATPSRIPRAISVYGNSLSSIASPGSSTTQTTLNSQKNNFGKHSGTSSSASSVSSSSSLNRLSKLKTSTKSTPNLKASQLSLSVSSSKLNSRNRCVSSEK